MKKLMRQILAFMVLIAFTLTNAAFLDLPFVSDADSVNAQAIEAITSKDGDFQKELTIADTVVILHKAFKDSEFVPEDWQNYGWFVGFYEDYDAPVSRAIVCSLMLQAMDLPTLQPVLYDSDTTSKSLFSAYMLD